MAPCQREVALENGYDQPSSKIDTGRRESRMDKERRKKERVFRRKGLYI